MGTCSHVFGFDAFVFIEVDASNMKLFLGHVFRDGIDFVDASRKHNVIEIIAVKSRGLFFSKDAKVVPVLVFEFQRGCAENPPKV